MTRREPIWRGIAPAYTSRASWAATYRNIVMSWDHQILLFAVVHRSEVLGYFSRRDLARRLQESAPMLGAQN